MKPIKFAVVLGYQLKNKKTRALLRGATTYIVYAYVC